MYCQKCGNQLQDTEKFCAQCGTPVQPAQGQPMQVAPQPPKKKKNGVKPLLIAIPVIVVVLCIVIAVNASSLYGFGVRTFGGADAYFKYVEGKAVEEAAETISAMYQNNGYVGALTDDIGMTTGVSLSLSDSITDMLADLSGMEDWSWAKSISLKTEINKKANAIGMDMGVKLGKTDIVSLEIAMDGAGERITARLPELSDTYLGLDMKELEYAVPELYELVMDVLEQDIDIPNALQDAEKTEGVLGKYVGIIMDSIEGVEKEKGKILANDIEQSCTILTLDVTYGLIYNILDAVYDVAEDDAELEQILVEILDAAAVMDGGYYTGEELYEELMYELDAAKEDLLEYEDLDEVVFTLIDYVADNKIIGRTLEFGDDAIWYAYAEDGNEYGFEAMADSIAVLSKGEIKGGKLNGVVGLFEYDENILSLQINKLNLKELKKGFVNGNITIALDEDMLYDMDLDMLTYMGSNAVFTLDMETNAKSGKVVFGIGMEGEEPLASLTVENKIHGAGKVAVPGAKADVIVLEDEDELLEFITDLNFDKILKNLEKAKLPEELLEELETIVSYLALAGMY